MKKTLFLFVVALMSLWVSAQAQETVSFNDLFTYVSEDAGYGFADGQEIVSKLSSKGYKVTSSNVKEEIFDFDLGDFVMGVVTKEMISKNGINILLKDGYLTEIAFGNKSELNNFLAEMKAKGWEGEGNIYGWQNFNYGQPIMATVDGLKIIFNVGE